MLRSSLDIAGTAPAGLEYITYNASESGAGTAPRLVVTYTIIQCVDWTLSGVGAMFNQTNVQAKIGTYSLEVKRFGADCYAYQSFAGYANYLGQTATAGCWVYATVANRGCITIGDGVTTTVSAYHTGVAGWQWLTVSQVIAAGASELRLRLNVNNGDTTVYFDGAALVIGATIAQSTAGKMESVSMVTYDVVDKANNWLLGENNVMSYMDYYYHYGDTYSYQARFEPNTYISGSTLPDRTLNGNNGTITWELTQQV
jgi:hypothetical protein